MKKYKIDFVTPSIVIIIAIVLYIIIGFISSYIVNRWFIHQTWVRFTIYEGFSSISLLIFGIIFSMYICYKKQNYILVKSIGAFVLYLFFIIPIERTYYEDYAISFSSSFKEHYQELSTLFGLGKDILFTSYLWQCLYLLVAVYFIKGILYYRKLFNSKIDVLKGRDKKIINL